jgi:hypothetical protein
MSRVTASFAKTTATLVAMSDDYVVRREAERILAKNAVRLAKIEKDLVARIIGRVGAGEDPQVATFEEIQQALAQLDAASIEVRKELAALPQKVRRLARPDGRL